MTAFVTAPSIAWGPGAVEQLSSLGARRAAVVVDPAVAQRAPEVRVLEELARGDAAIELIRASPHPQELANVVELAGQLRAFRPDWVVAIGGGATIDGTKAARLWLERPELDPGAVPTIVPFPDPPASRLVAIPTTSGSGADASWACDLFAADGTPAEMAHRGFVPEWALVDPAFAADLPPERRREGGFETGAIAIEAYLSAWSNPFSDALALGAVATVLRELPASLKWTDEPEARASLHYAATQAGLAASNAQRGLAHALARALVRPSGLAYGTLLAIALPWVLEFDRTGAREKLERLAAALVPASPADRGELALRWRRFGEAVGLPRDLATAKVAIEPIFRQRDHLVRAALASPGVVANPRVPRAEELGELLDRMIGVRPAPESTANPG